jgi:replicative DNA helicase
MLDCKVLNWMLRGSIEYNKIIREFDKDLVSEVFDYDYRPIILKITEYYSRHKATPTINILKKILSEDELDHGFLDLVEAYEVSDNEIGYYIDQMKERYNKRIVKRLVNSCLEENSDIKEVNKEVKRIVGKTDRLYKSDVFSEGRLKDSVKTRLDNYEFVKNNPNLKQGMLSGFVSLDDYTWGLKNSEMMVIGGASSSGKSLLMMNMAINAYMGTNDPVNGVTGRKDGKNVLYISLEMSKEQLEQRVDANIAHIPHRGLMRGTLSEADIQNWKKSLKFQRDHDKVFYILDMPRNSTMAEIEAKFEIITGIFKPEAIFVDYLQLMSPSTGATGSDWMDVGKVAEELHEFCRKKDLPVITAAQRKASAKKSSGKYKDNVDLEDLGRSKMIGDNATVVLLIGKREDEDLREDIEIYIVKNRDGPKGKVVLKKTFDKSKIEELPEGWIEDTGDENAV